MTEHNILVSSMWLGLTLAPTQKRYDAFLNRARPAFARLIESILLHDKVVVPTDDYLSLTAIVDVLGERAAIALMESGALSFLRPRGFLTYVGGGGGVLEANFPFRGDGTDATAVGADIPEAVSWALSGLTKRPDDLVGRLAVENSTEVNLSKLRTEVANAAYSDFRLLPGCCSIDPARIPGLTGKSVKILGGQSATSVNGHAEVVLALATAHLELRLMAGAAANDSATVTPIGHALRARQLRLGGTEESFAHLRELADVPDIAEAVLAKQINIETLTKLRASRAGSAFRAWFHDHSLGDSTDVARAYIDLLSKIPAGQTVAAKILRYVVTTGLGFIPFVGGALGAAASAIDDFVVDKLTECSQPKFFIDELKLLGSEVRKNAA